MRNKDLAERRTDKLIEEVEEKISKEYSLALKEAKRKFNKYFKQFEKEDEAQKQKLKNWEITEKDYKEWRTIHLYSTKRYKYLSENLAKDLTLIDKKVMSITDGYLPEAYALNFNYSTYDIELNTQINTNFTLYSRETVEKILKEEPDLLPKRKVDIPKDMRWNKQHIDSAILQGVLQGDSIDSISYRLQKVTDMDRRAAVRNARTMMTGAQNGGRLDAMKRASDLGIGVKKEWMATLDSRTRDSHARLYGERKDLDEPFSNGLMKPGDPNGNPEEVYNCRCTLVGYLPKYNNITTKRITYDEWVKNKEANKRKKHENRKNRW